MGQQLPSLRIRFAVVNPLGGCTLSRETPDDRANLCPKNDRESQVPNRMNPIRVLISKIGLDGHDRGAKLIVRNLRDAGMDVIYTGLWQTPASTVQAAIQEDVDVLGVSLLSAAHMTIMPEVLRLCAAGGVPDLPVMVGGIIPEDEKPELLRMGLAGVFTPGTSMAQIIQEMQTVAAQRRARLAAESPATDLSTDAGLARAITRLCHGLPLDSYTVQPGLKIGITGAPGVGKSTFIGRLATELAARDCRVGVIAVDPTSPLTGGALLGDRLRMMSSEPNRKLFVRSLSSSGLAGGLGPHCAEIARLLAAAGYKIVLIETVGAGQTDVEIRNVADDVLLLLMPGSGDAVQFAKAGIVEIATGFVINKSDLPGADQTRSELRSAIDDGRPIWSVSSLRGEGLAPLCDWVQTRLKN